MAENITNPVQGLAYLEFDLRLPTQTLFSANRLTYLLTHRIYETLFGYNETEISFRVQTTTFFDSILKALDSNGNPLIRFRWGLGSGNDVTWQPWQLHYVIRHNAHFEGVGAGAGHRIKLTTRDLLHLIDRSSRTEHHAGTISDIMQSLADDNDLDAVIEQTQGSGLWIQSYEGDFEFARRRLVKRARSKRGRGNYYMFIRDNVLHFHTLEYQSVIKDFSYYDSPGMRLEAFDLAQDKLEDGSAGVRVVIHDPYTGQSSEILSDPSKAIRLGNSIPRLDKIEGAERNIREHRLQIRDEEAGSTALCQNAYEFARNESFQLKLQTSATPIVRPGELLRLNIDPSSQNTSSWSGIYLVASAQHMIISGQLNSVYVLQRGEQIVPRNANQNLAAYGVDSLQDDKNAPGYDLNVRDTQSSVVTKGAGKTLSSGVYLTVQDPNAAPVPPSST